jgi:surface protein
MTGMFTKSVFNQPLSGWNTSNVTTMRTMFSNATLFNQPIGSWNVSGVTDMYQMFNSATAFNQDIGSWNISGVTNFSDFMVGKTFSNFSATNLDSIYNGWSSLPSVKPSISINFGTIKYTSAGVAGKAILTGSPYNWVIVDGGI